jgi:hypothetical protein
LDDYCQARIPFGITSILSFVASQSLLSSSVSDPNRELQV